MNLTDADRKLARLYIAYVWAWKQTGKYEDVVREMKKTIRVSSTKQPTVYEVWVNGRSGSIEMNPVEVRWMQEDLGLK